MKFSKIYSAVAASVMAMAMTGCDEERDFIIIDEKLPIKSSTFYMVGDATPNGWSIDNPTAFAQTEEDPLVFVWEGQLNKGEMKGCLTPGSWDAPFIRPVANGEEIGKEPITDYQFAMHAGDPDEKWRVTEAGSYRLTFNLRNWTFSSVFTGELQKPDVTPIEVENLYIVGDATPNGWNIDAPTACVKKSAYVYVYEGELKPGEMKACAITGSWDVEFVRPQNADCRIDKNGVEVEDFVYTTGPDTKWKVADHGEYRLTFDLEHWTVKAEFLKEIEAGNDPIETETLFMIGDATPGGWSMDNASEFTVDPDNKYIFTWEGELVEGSMKACTERDGTFSCPFLRPATDGCAISADGVAEPGFVYTTSPDDKWQVTAAGRYRITFNLNKRTIEAVKVG